MDPNLFDPPASVRPGADAAALLAAANAEHEAGWRAERASLEHYRKAGEVLIQAKAAAGHGKWLALLEGRSTISQQRANEYVRLAAGWSKLPPGGDFTLKEALRLIEGKPGAEEGETLDDLMKRIGEKHDLILMGAVRSLRCRHRLGFLLAEMFARDESATRAFLSEQGMIEADARCLIKWAGQRGEDWEPTLKDADEYVDEELDAILTSAGIPLDEDDAESSAIEA